MSIIAEILCWYMRQKMTHAMKDGGDKNKWILLFEPYKNQLDEEDLCLWHENRLSGLFTE